MISSVQTMTLVEEAQKVLGNGSAVAASSPSAATHWSYSLQVGNCVLGAIVAIAGGFMQNGTAVLAGSALLVTNGIGAFYNKKFTALATLGTYVNLLTLRVKELANEILGLKQIHGDLAKENNLLKKDLTQTKDAFEKGKKALECKIEEFENVNESLKATAKKMEILSLLYDKLKTSTTLFSAEMQQFIDQSIHFEGSGDQLKGQVHRFDEENDEFNEMVKNFDAENSEFVEENKQLAKLNDDFKSQLLLMKKMSEDEKKDKAEMKKKIELLSNSSDKISAGMSGIEEAQRRAEKSEAKLFKINEELEHLRKIAPWVHFMKEELTNAQLLSVAAKIKQQEMEQGA